MRWDENKSWRLPRTLLRSQYESQKSKVINILPIFRIYNVIRIIILVSFLINDTLDEAFILHHEGSYLSVKYICLWIPLLHSCSIKSNLYVFMCHDLYIIIIYYKFHPNWFSYYGVNNKHPNLTPTFARIILVELSLTILEQINIHSQIATEISVRFARSINKKYNSILDGI